MYKKFLQKLWHAPLKYMYAAGPAEALEIWSGNYPYAEKMHVSTL